MGKITIEYEGELRTRAKYLHTDNEIITDAPLDNHGKGETFSPTDLVASSLGSCLLTIMGIVANRKQIDMTGCYAEVEKNMSENPRRISSINIDIYLSDNISNKDKDILCKASKHCPVHNSLNKDINIKINFN